MSDPPVVHQHKLSLLEENFRAKRIHSLSRLLGFALIAVMLCVATVGVGICGVVLTIFQEDHMALPYVIPIGCIAGILGLIPSASALHLARCSLRQERAYKRSRSAVPGSLRKQITIVFISALHNFVLMLMCCAVSVLGVYLCVTDHSNCDDEYKMSKLVISAVVTALSFILWCSSFFYTRWYFIYTRAFGFKSKVERQYESNKRAATELQKRPEQTQQTAANEEEEAETQDTSPKEKGTEI